MTLINRIEHWGKKHRTVLGRRPDNGRKSLDEMDELLTAIHSDTEQICKFIRILLDETAEMKQQVVQSNVADADSD